MDMLATARMIDLLDARGAFASADLERAITVLDVIIGHTSTWPEAERPNLQALVTRFERRDDALQSAEPSATPPIASASKLPPAGPIASKQALLDQVRTMVAWLRNEENGYLPAAWLVRTISWDTIHELPPADASGRTRVEPPRGELRQQFKRLVL